MAFYANIIVDISHEKLDRTFQYRIPEEMMGILQIGMLVKVPFGAGNRTMKGYVIEITDQAEYEISKIKEVDSIEETGIAIESQLIALAAWIRRNYGGTMNHALKTVIPVKQQSKAKEKRTVKLLLGRDEAADLLAEYKRKHYTARERFLAALLENPSISYEVVTQKLNITSAVIKSMEEKQILAVEHTRTYRNPIGDIQSKGYHMTLNEGQQRVVDEIQRDYANGKRQTYLLHGVTGSGKTEVYMELIAGVIAQGKKAIVLIPEIALTYQTVMRFYNRFGDRVSIMNSRLSPGERYDQFLRAKNGEIDIMIGPRSALFTPFGELGLIIIDEEHEGSYKSETIPRYHAREVAIKRAQMTGASVVLGSATPSVDSYYKAKQGEYRLLELKERVSSKPLARCKIVDLREEMMRGNRSILSIELQKKMEERLKRKEQTILFLNRRGMSGFVSCRACGFVVKCPHCDVSLSLHNNGKMVCHYCGHEEPAPKLCPKCSSKYISGFKAGTQKIEQVVHQIFPDAKTLRMDLDTTRGKDSYSQILAAFANQEADILIGTQMIVKGHDFPNVTLVGILAADLSLHIQDYRAPERTFQLLTQAAGRAGRGEKPGEVVIQTYSPTHYSIIDAKKQDYEAFYKEEITYRNLMHYPPVSHMLVMLITSKNQEAVEKMAEHFARMVKNTFREDTQIAVIGPADAAIAKVNDIYKKVIYYKHSNYEILVQIKDGLEKYMQLHPELKDIGITFDFNPMNGF